MQFHFHLKRYQTVEHCSTLFSSCLYVCLSITITIKMKKSLPMVAFLAIALAAAPILFSYKAEAAVIQHYCYTDASNDDHCFSDRVQCQQSAQQAGQDKNDCDKTFKEKYTATINGLSLIHI